MTDFEYEIKDKKRIARMARYRKRGSKSKKCSLSTDGMTRKQWEQKNGAVVAYSLKKPVSWDDFKTMPTHIQKEYLNNLVTSYNVNATSLAQMFNVHPSTVKRVIDTNDLGIAFRVGKNMNRTQRDAWEQFLGAQGSEEDKSIPPDAQDTVFAESHNKATMIESYEPMTMTQFSFSFAGKIDASMIANSIIGVIGHDAVGEVQVVCTI